MVRLLERDGADDRGEHDRARQHGLSLEHDALGALRGRRALFGRAFVAAAHAAAGGVAPAAPGGRRGPAHGRPLFAMLLREERHHGLRALCEPLDRGTDARQVARDRALHHRGRLFDGGEIVDDRRRARGGRPALRGLDSGDGGLHVGIAQGHDELRDVRRRIDGHLDAVDVRGSLVAALRVLELELAPDLQEAEVAAHGDRCGARVTDLGAHRRGEPVDVQTHLRPRENLGSGAHGGNAADALERIDALRVHVGEANAELSALVGSLRPDDLARGEDALTRAPLEPAGQRLSLLGQIGRSKVHPVFGDVHGLRFERRPERTPNLDQPVERQPRRSGRAAILGVHFFLRRPPR